MSEPDTGNYFTKGEDQPLLTGHVVIYGEEGSGKTTLGMSMSKLATSRGSNLKDGLLIAWDRGAHDSVKGNGFTMDTINVRKAAETKGIVPTLNNLDKIIPPATREGRSFVLHSSLSALDRIVGKHCQETFPDKKDTQEMWTLHSSLLTFYAMHMNAIFPEPIVHIYEMHAKAIFEQTGSREKNDKLKREAEGISPIMPDATGKGGALFTRDASLVIHTDVKAGVGQEPDSYVLHPRPGGNYKAKTRYGRVLPKEMVNATLPQLFALVEKNLRALDGSK